MRAGMGKRPRLVTGLLVIVALIGSSCGRQLTEYTCLGWRTTAEDASKRIGVDVPTPSYLPDGYEIKEVYIKERNHDTVDHVVLLISNEDIIWQGDESQCKIKIEIIYGFMPGLKMPWARDVMLGEIAGYEVVGHLVEEEEGYNSLWYQWNPGSRGQVDFFTTVITAYIVISEEELLKIAESTLY
jgi:hypothetical protein